MVTITTIMTIIRSTATITAMRMITLTTTMSTTSHAITSMTIPISIAMGRRKGPRLPAPDAVAGAAASDEHTALYRLMTWLSPSFPIGAFSYSSGIEWAVEAGDIDDAETLKRWLSAMLTDGAGFCDGVFLCHAWQASANENDAALVEAAELAAAFTPSRERQLETT